MTQVLNRIRDVDPNDSEAVKDAVNIFFQKLTKITDADPIKWLRTLEDVINRFPKYCMSHRGTIESLVTTSIDCNDYYYVIEAAKCAHAVQQVRRSQEKAATPKTSWQDQMNLLCNAVHSLIDTIFPNAVDIYKGINKGKNQEQSSTSSLTAGLLNISSTTSEQSTSTKKTLLQIRLRNILCYIQAMLVEVYPVAKPVRPQIVLDMIVRVLSVSSGSKNTDVDVEVVKIEALRTLDALVACLGPNLIPFSPLVFRLLMQTFRWSSENLDQDCSKVRCTAYDSIGNWLHALHCHRSAADSRTSWEEELTDHILKDTAPVEKIVQLTMGPQPTKNMSKKAKRKLANARLLESSIASHMPGEKNKISIPQEISNEVTKAALACAETFLLVCGRFLKPVTHKLLQERAIRECYNSDKYSEEVLIQLLRVAEATRKTTPAGVPPPTQHCLQLYSTLVNTTHREISKFCTQALLDIRLHLHCSPPSLNYALQAPQEKPPSPNKRKISEKNKAALESLLGPDRVLVSSSREEVITIPDEPLSKKKRLEDVDKISVSSDSVKSVEISDDSDVEEVFEYETEMIVEEEETSVSEEITAVEVNKENNDVALIVVSNEDVVETYVEGEKLTAVMQKDLSSKPQIEKHPKASEIDNEVTVQSKPVAEKNESGYVVVEQQNISIHLAPKQVSLNVSTDTNDVEEGPLSLEVACDDPNTGQGTFNVLNKGDDEVLPSTKETDDVMITSGQAIKSSPKLCIEKKPNDTDRSEVESSDVVRVNGNVSENDIIENGVNIPVDNTKDCEIKETKVLSKDGRMSIEDMMADFVDEVNEDVAVSQVLFTV